MSRRLITLTAALLGSMATLFGARWPRAACRPARRLKRAARRSRQPDQDRPAPFRVSVDVVAVDVQVIDRSGQPVPDLGPEKFTVTINGRRRRVVSAERIMSDTGGPPSVTSQAAASVLGRVIVLAVDCISFDATASRGVIEAAQQFVKRLSPNDFIGLAAYPNGPKVDPTRDHDVVLRALANVTGQRDLAELSQFHVRPSEMIDLTRELYSRGGGPRLDAIAARECGDPPDPFCRQRLITDVNGTALYYEGQGAASLGMLNSLVNEMATFTGRKTMVLISGGMIASDTPGGRPDLSEPGIRIGKQAALANTAIYTLFLDASFIERFSAQTRTGDKSLDNWNRDSRSDGALARAVLRRGRRRPVQRAGRQRRGGVGAHPERTVVVLPARRGTRGRRSRRPHARDLGQDDASERHDSRAPVGECAGARRNAGAQGLEGADAGPEAAEAPAPTPTSAPAAATAATARAARSPGARGYLRPRRLRQRAGVADEIDESDQHHHRLPNVGQPVAERSEAHRGLRAGAGVRGAAQRTARRAKRADDCSASITCACVSRPAPISSSAGGSSPRPRRSRVSSSPRARSSSFRARCSAARPRPVFTSRMRSCRSSNGCAAG